MIGDFPHGGAASPHHIASSGVTARIWRRARPGQLWCAAGHDRAVEFPSLSEALAEQQYADGLAAFRRGDNAACRRLSEAALATAAAVGSERRKALGHIGLSRADFRDGD